MNKEELIKNLIYTKEKHKNDKLDTFDTDISAMCADVLQVLKNCIEIPEGTTNGDVIRMLSPNEEAYENISTMNYYLTVRFKEEWWNAPFKL